VKESNSESSPPLAKIGKATAQNAQPLIVKPRAARELSDEPLKNVSEQVLMF